MAAANINPIFPLVGDLSNNAGTGCNQLITSAANDFTGVSGNNSLIFTADATNGSWVERIRLKPGGTNVASVMRFFANNGSTPGTATNNIYLGEISLPATTANAAGVTGPDLDYPLGFVLPAGWRLYGGLGTTVSAGWVMMVVGGRY